jgi:hypothetical protein
MLIVGIRVPPKSFAEQCRRRGEALRRRITSTIEDPMHPVPHSIEADPLSMTRDGRLMPASDAVVHERELHTAALRESPVVFETVRSATGDVEKAEAAGALAKLVVAAAGGAARQNERSQSRLPSAPASNGSIREVVEPPGVRPPTAGR